ncbi:MAG: hypothetical protein ACJ74Z_09490 [Bryobacteraceae bacterium]
MSWVRVGQYLNMALGLTLIVRLLCLRLQHVYRVFCLFLVCEFVASLLSFIKSVADEALPDYRIMWMLGRAVIWIFTLWTVYALLDAVLANLPGVLRFSRKLLNSAFVVAVIFGLLTARPQYSVADLSGQTDPIQRIVDVAIVMDRVVCTIALFALVAILSFLLWFPVKLSKNLIVFTTGFLVYFAAKGALLLTYNLWSTDILRLRAVSNIIMLISGACFAYWAIFVSRQGETVSVRIGHSWHVEEQERLIGQLEAINAALLRSAVRR